MAKYEITHRCNHKDVVSLFGPGKERERKLEWLASLPCAQCASIDRISAAKDVHELQEAAGLPRLMGSEKQVAWAVGIRQDFLVAWKRVEQKLTEAAIGDSPSAQLAEQLLFEGDAYIEAPLSHADAKYWIDNRDSLTESALNQHLYAIRHKIADEFGAIVGTDLPISDADKREIIRMAIEERKAVLESKRREAADAREKAAAAEVSVEAEKQQRQWRKKDEAAQMVRAALGQGSGEATVAIWTKAGDKRVYCNWGRSESACLYVSGNGKNRPGTLCIDGKVADRDALSAALAKAAADWTMVSFSVGLRGEAK